MRNIELVRDDKLFDITFTVKDADGTVIDLTDVSTITFKTVLISDSTLKIDGSCTRSAPYTAGICTYTVQEGDLDTIGVYHAELELTYVGGKIITATMADIEVIRDLP